MKTRRESFHWGVRNGLSIIFWLHAIGGTRLLADLTFWNGLRGVLILQVSLFSAILFYSYVAANAGWSLFVDILYVYASPVIVLGRLSWISIKKFGKALTSVSPALAELFKTTPSPQKPEMETKSPEKESNEVPNIFRRAFAPFLHLSAAWCVLVTISDQKWILILSVVALFSIAVTSIVSFHEALNDSSTFIDKVNIRMKAVTEKIVSDLSKAAPMSNEFKASISNLRVYGAVFKYLSSTEAVRRVTRKFSLALAVPTYFYTSLLCGFLYYDLARLSGVKWALGEALIDSMYMPIAFTDLPHLYIVRFLGGLQVASLILIGYDAIFRNVNSSMERLSSAAHGLTSLLEVETVTKAMQTFDTQTAPAVVEAKTIESTVTSSAAPPQFEEELSLTRQAD